MNIPVAALILAALLIPLDSDDLPPGTVAVVNGSPITESEFHAHIAAKPEGIEEGAALIEQMIREKAIEQEAEKRGVRITVAMLRSCTEKQDRQIRLQTNGEMGLLDYLREQGKDEKEFFRLLDLHIRHEEMARIDFGLDRSADVPIEKLNLWMKELLSRKKIVREETGQNAVARVDDEIVSRRDFGRRLAAHLGEKTAAGFLTEMIGIRLILARAEAMEIALTEEEIDAEFAERDRKLKSRTGLEGVSYGDYLKAATGQDMESLRKSDKFRAEMLFKKIAGILLAEKDLEAFFDNKKKIYEQRHGRAARVSTIFLKAAHFSNQHVSRTFEQAERELDTIAQRIRKGENTFENMARFYSEHQSAEKGGDLGFLPPGKGDPGAIGQAAIEVGVGDIAGPIKTSQGTHLVMVMDKRGPVEYKAIREIVVRDARQDLYASFIREAEIVRKF